MMENFNYKNIPWSQAEELLGNITGSTILEIEETIRKRGAVPFKYNSFESWEDLSDIDVLASSQINDYLEGMIYIITDISYVKKTGVFVVKSERLNEFVSSYFGCYKECFFNGDVIFISPEKQIIIIFDHNGILSYYHLPL